ncbi:hypothetical protein [Hymenobacter sp. UV11]|uniref:hypothetical protein n=1 Tax=Hymenobacter sp. UV11 TaxID=1849735 RepID=UPI001414E258|nr:hypothetical protein [Hymenobacter sp. UV11]
MLLTSQPKKERKSVQLSLAVHGRLMALVQTCSLKEERSFTANEVIKAFLDAQEKSPVA